MNFRRAAWACLLLWMCVSCFGHEPELRIAANREPGICRVAVLPFVNQTKKEGVGEMLTRIVISEMVEQGLDVTEEGVVKRFLERERYLPGTYVSADLIRKMGDEFGVRAVVGGVVTEAREVGQQVKLGFIFWVRDTRDGHFLWGTYYVREGEDYRTVLHFGKISSMSGLAGRMVEEILQASMKRRLFRCRVSS